MKKSNVLLYLILLLSATNVAQLKRAITIEDLWNLRRIGSCDISQNDSLIAFEIAKFNMEENSSETNIYICKTDGSELKKLTASVKKETKPKFIPGADRISFICENQIYSCDYSGNDILKLTEIYSGVLNYKWSPDGKRIAIISNVYPECMDQKCNKRKDDEKKETKVKASIFTELLYRHWNDWRGDKRSHLFLFEIEGDKLIDLTPGALYDVPPIALGGGEDFDFSPDCKEIVFAANKDSFQAISVNNDIFIVDIAELTSEKTHTKISISPGNDNSPNYSPDGKYLAFLSMQRGGYEADKQDIILFDRVSKELINLTKTFDRSPQKFIWASDSKIIYFTAPNETTVGLYSIALGETKPKLIFPKYKNEIIGSSELDKYIYLKIQKNNSPNEIYKFEISVRKINQLTHINKDILDQLEMNPIETIWHKGADQHFINAIVLRPPKFDPSKKYPAIFLIHGGPQGHWADDFHFRWNLQLFASKGYVVIAPNPRGSIGYGQKFTDDISQDWGGKAYFDIMNCVDYCIKNFHFIDSNNIFAAGGSYGGYMINWIAGQTDRFNALVSHAGVFNLESMYGTTEELWFPEWEYGGAPWENRELYRKFSPHNYVENYKTPILVIHGANDFRVPEEQAFQLFTALQRLGIRSKFLYYPDETHFISKPQNARLWWNTIFQWFEENKK